MFLFFLLLQPITVSSQRALPMWTLLGWTCLVMATPSSTPAKSASSCLEVQSIECAGLMERGQERCQCVEVLYCFINSYSIQPFLMLNMSMVRYFIWTTSKSKKTVATYCWASYSTYSIFSFIINYMYIKFTLCITSLNLHFFSIIWQKCKESSFFL